VFAGLVSAHALLQLACIASACLGVALTRNRALGAIAIALAASAAIAWFLRTADPVTPRGLPNGGAVRALAWVVAGATLTWAATLWARLWRLAADRPSYDWDGLYYHIPAINEWVVAGRVRWLDTFSDVPFVNYPMGVEAHTFLMHQAFGLAGLVDACNLWYWPLGVLAVVVLAALLGAAGPWRWLAGGLLAGAPVLVCQGVTTYIDPASASCVMAAVTASVLLVFHDGRTPAVKAVLWGASVGLVLGSKGTGLPMAGVIGTAVLLGMGWQEGWRRWPAWLPRLVLGLGIAFLVGGYWYTRAAYHTGNPIYPIQVRFGSLVLIEGYDASTMMSGNQPEWLTRFPSLLRAPVSWLQLDAPIQGYAPVGGLGYVWLLAGVPAIAWLAAGAVRRRTPDVHRAAFALGLVVVLLLVQPAAWWSRFTVWLHVLGLAACAVALHRVSRARLVPVRSLALACAVVLAGVAAWESERTLRIEQARGRTPGVPGNPYISTQEAFFPGLATTPGFDRFLAADRIARGPWSRAGTLLGGVLAMPLGQRHIHLLPAQPGEADIERLRSDGVSWIVWDVAANGPVPGVLTRHALEHVAYTRADDVDFHAVRIGAATRALE
jgi:hypothetical protein